MIKFRIVRKVTIEEIYEIVAETPLAALAIATIGVGLSETIETGSSKFQIVNSEPVFEQ